jgi:nickel transport system substrate-binding protein
MGAVVVMDNWFCNDQGQFVLETNAPFYPLLQELSYIRPLTIAAPSSFANGMDSHPELENSCNPGDPKWDEIEALESFTCVGLNSSIGTGPFQFVSREQDADGNDVSVLFAANKNYWGIVPEIEFVELKTFADTQKVEDALLVGDLDMALGIGPLSATQIQKLKFFHSNIVDVHHSDVLQHSLMVMNTNKHPTSDITVRRAIMHAVNKARFIEAEFGGLEQPVGQSLPESAPYCNVDLSPKWSYDFEKAQLLACPVVVSKSDSGLSTGGIAGIAVVCVVILGLAGFVIQMISREKQGKPMFVSDATEKGENA